MNYTITAPQTIDTTITLPASKSISNRALVIHQLTNGALLPDNLSDCDDTDVMVRAMEVIQGARSKEQGAHSLLSTSVLPVRRCVS